MCVCVLFAHVRCEKRNSAGYCPLRWTCRSPGWSVNSRRTGRVVAERSEFCGFKTVLFSFRDWIQIFVRVIFPTIPPNLHDAYGNSKSWWLLFLDLFQLIQGLLPLERILATWRRSQWLFRKWFCQSFGTWTSPIALPLLKKMKFCGSCMFIFNLFWNVSVSVSWRWSCFVFRSRCLRLALGAYRAVSFSRFFLGHHRFEHGGVIALSLCYRIFLACAVIWTCTDTFMLHYQIFSCIAYRSNYYYATRLSLALARMLGCYAIRSSRALAYRSTATLVGLLLQFFMLGYGVFSMW